MFKRISRLWNFIKLKMVNQERFTLQGADYKDKIPTSNQKIKRELEHIFADCSDFVLREIIIGNQHTVKIMLGFIDGLVNKELLYGDILQTLINQSDKIDLVNWTGPISEMLQERLLNDCEVKELKDLRSAVDEILGGNTVIFIDGEKVAIKLGTKGWEARGVEEPGTEAVVRGPREGFTETLRTNTALLRRKIKSSEMKFESLKIGEYSRTDVAICYIKGIANEDVLRTLRRRLKKIKLDGILESGYIEEFIEDAPFSIFPTVGNSERPDKVAALLLEGRVAILVDGTPFVLTVPHIFIETLHSPEDYYSRPYYVSLIRNLRFLAFLITTSLPAVYVALISFHQSAVPFKLLITIAASREGIPFSAFTEALVMGVIFELLREAGIRMPRPIGQALSIVGALVLGEAAVRSGIASDAMVMITALTAISGIILEPLSGTLPIIRFVLLIAANFYGFLGLLLAAIMFLIHLCSVRSFGVPYLAPFSPISGQDLKDTYIRVPLWTMLTRPTSISKATDKKRQNFEYIKKED